MSYFGDFDPGDTIRIPFNTRGVDGAPITLASGTLRVYKDGGTTEDDSGITLTTDLDGRTGLHSVAIDTSADGTFYAAGSDFDVVITVGTVDSISVVGHCVGSFSLQNRSHLRPTTAGRTLDVTAGGEAGIDLDNASGALGTAQFDANFLTAALIANGAIDAATFAADVDAEILSYLVDDATRIDASALNTATGTSIPAILEDTGTTLQAELDGIQADTEDIQTRLPAALIGGRIDATVGAMQADVLTSSALAASAVTEIQSGLSTVTTAQVQFECEEALQTYHLDYFISTCQQQPLQAVAIEYTSPGVL